MEKLEKINPTVIKITQDRVVVSKSVFDTMLKTISILTDTVNNLIEHQEASENAIIAIGKTLD